MTVIFKMFASCKQLPAKSTICAPSSCSVISHMWLDLLITFPCTIFFTEWNNSPAALSRGFSRGFMLVWSVQRLFNPVDVTHSGSHGMQALDSKSPQKYIQNIKLIAISCGVIGHYNFPENRWLHVEYNRPFVCMCLSFEQQPVNTMKWQSKYVLVQKKGKKEKTYIYTVDRIDCHCTCGKEFCCMWPWTPLMWIKTCFAYNYRDTHEKKS